MRVRPAQVTAWIAPLVILLIAAALRITHLDFQSFWLDELATWQSISQATLIDVWRDPAGPQWPPAYFLGMYGWLRMAGDTEFALRYPSVLGGVAAVAAIYSLGRRLFTVKAAHFAAILTAVLAWPIYYSQDARPYSWFMALGIIVTYLWLRLCQQAAKGDRIPRSVIAGYILSGILNLYLHPYALILLGLHSLLTMVWIGEHWRQSRIFPRFPLRVFAVVYGALALSYVPWIPRLLAVAGHPYDWLDAPQSLWAGVEPILSKALNGNPILTWVGLLLAGVAVFVPCYRRVRDGYESIALWSALLCLALIVIPTLIAYAYTMWVTPILVARYLIPFVPVGLYLLIGAALGLPRLPGGLHSVLAFSIAVSLIAYLVFSMGFYVTEEKAQFRELGGFLVRQQASRERSLWVGERNVTYLEYYFRDAAWGPEFDEVSVTPWTIPDLEAVVAEHEPELLWYAWVYQVPNVDLLNYLDRSYPARFRREWWGAGVWVMDIPSDAQKQGD